MLKYFVFINIIFLSFINNLLAQQINNCNGIIELEHHVLQYLKHQILQIFPKNL